LSHDDPLLEELRTVPLSPTATKVFHWPNNDPDNDAFSYQQTKNAFMKTRENIYNLLKKFLILENIH